MAVLKPRTRLISFRISDEEYQDLAAKTAAGGARSISDFSRTALFQALTGNGSLTHLEQSRLPGYMADLIKSMQELGRVITKLSGQIEKNSVVKE
jgi:hypothetical protein